MTSNIKCTLEDYCNQHPEVKHLLIEYSPKNKKKPSEIGYKYSREKVIWYCKKHNYEWEALVSNRINYPNTPCCSGKHATKDKNFVTEYPTIALDWDYEANGDLKPEQLVPHSHIRVHWKCHKCGHKWITMLTSRTQRMSGCPECTLTQTSKAEKLLKAYIQKTYPQANKVKIDEVEFDIYIPDLKVAIEYDGYPWHLEKIETHTRKLEIAKENNIKLINIAECKEIEEVEQQYKLGHTILFYKVNSTYDISDLLIQFREFIKQQLSIDLGEVRQEDFVDILNMVQSKELEGSIYNHPELTWIKDWIAPEDIVSKNNI